MAPPNVHRSLKKKRYRSLLVLLPVLSVSFFDVAICAKSSNRSTATPANASSTKKAKPVPKGACISQGGRFLPFPNHGKRPRKSARGKADALSFCRVYKDSTCCSRVNTDAALLSVRMLQIGAEPRDECTEIWEALECAVCHPTIGTQLGPPAICQSFCGRLFSACKDAFFAADPIDKVFLPCSSRDTLCSRGDEWANNSADFCQLAGYDVIDQTSLEAPQRQCFDGTLSILKTGSSGSQGTGHKASSAGGFGSSNRWEQWFGEDGGAFLGSMVTWAVGGLVLTGAAVFLRWRALRGRKKRAALLASKQMAEARAKQQAMHSARSTRAVRTGSSPKK